MILEHLADTPLDSTDEAVQMAVTLAAAYFVRGDIGQAVRVCRKAIAKAETLDSPVARASAYWNASAFEAEQGAVRDAIPLAERALALLAEGQDGRNLGRLRTHLGIMQLRMDPPQIDEAQQNLRAGSRGVPVVQRQPRRRRAQRAGPGARPLPGRRRRDRADDERARARERADACAAHRGRRQVARGSGARSSGRHRGCACSHTAKPC